MAVDPGGKFLYVANRLSDSISAYAIDARTGVLSEMSGSPFATGGGPYSISTDISGKFVYVTNGLSDDVSAYTMNASTGALTPMAGSPFAAGSYPISIALWGTTE